MAQTPAAVRIEHDLLGDLAVPADAYYGVQTARALENFHISGVQLRLYPDLIKAFAMVKLAAARANHDCGQFDREILTGIEGACQELIDGKLHDQFRLDVLPGRRRHLDQHERQRGHRQPRAGADGPREGRVPATATRTTTSTARSPPTTPTRRRCTWASRSATSRLIAAMNELVEAFRAKGREFADVLKMGRTQLQDAVPMTLGQEFTAFGETLAGEVRTLEGHRAGAVRDQHGRDGDRHRPERAGRLRREVHEGTSPRSPACPIHLAEDLIEATQDTQAFVLYSSCMKSLAIKLSKVCNDLRLLSSGPRCGLREINLPAKQPGSSIMPGKVNPVIPEVVNMVCFRVIGSDLTITMAAEGGPAAAERVRAGHRRLHLRGPDAVHQRRADAARALRRGHHRQPRRLRPLRRLQHRHGHRAQSGDRLRTRRPSWPPRR